MVSIKERFGPRNLRYDEIEGVLSGYLFPYVESGSGSENKPIVPKISYGPEEIMGAIIFVGKESGKPAFFDVNSTIYSFDPAEKTFKLERHGNRDEESEQRTLARLPQIYEKRVAEEDRKKQIEDAKPRLVKFLNRIRDLF